MAYSMSYGQFCKVAFGRPSTSLKTSGFAGDFDGTNYESFFRFFSARTGATAERVREATLTSYRDVLGDGHKTPWLLPFGKIQFCSQCLAEGESSYFRRQWRLAFITVCRTHRLQLSDTCPQCHANIQYRQSLSNHSYDSPFFSIVYCYNCSADLREGTEKIEVNEKELRFQETLFRGLNQSWIDLALNYRMSSQDYFTSLRKLARSLTTGKNAQNYQEAVICAQDIALSLVPGFEELRDQVESLPVQSRRVVMIMLGSEMEDWPLKPIGSFQDKGFYNRNIFKELQILNAQFSQATDTMS